MRHLFHIFLAPLLLCAFALDGCVSAPVTRGIPNLAFIDYTIVRGGQPTLEGWVWLRGIGITNVVKLNTEQEASDADAELLGMTIQKFPIDWHHQFFCEPDATLIWHACDAITPHTYIHCEHGQDRTGLVVACWRMDNGATKAAAEREMLMYGFHKSLFGLWEFWEHHY